MADPKKLFESQPPQKQKSNLHSPSFDIDAGLALMRSTPRHPSKNKTPDLHSKSNLTGRLDNQNNQDFFYIFPEEDDFRHIEAPPSDSDLNFGVDYLFDPFYEGQHDFWEDDPDQTIALR